MQSTCVAQSSSTVRTAAPLRSLRSIAAVATTRRGSFLQWTSEPIGQYKYLERTYPSSLLCIRTRKSTASFKVVLVPGDVLLVIAIVGLEHLPLGPLFRQRMFLVQHRSTDPKQRLLIALLQLKQIIHFMDGRQGAQDRARSLRLVGSCRVVSGKVERPRADVDNLLKISSATETRFLIA